MTTQTIGIAGTGRMGTAFARRFIETGHPVGVWNRTAGRTRSAVDAGATAVGSLAELAGSDVLVLSLTDAAAGAAVMDGLVAAGISGRLVIETSTLLPRDVATLAGRATDAGADYVECPVGGTVAPALKGQLLGFAGGTDAAFARAKPILETLCRRVEHLGPVGNGARMKLAVNLPLALYWETLGESLLLLRGAGIPAETAVSLIAESSAGPTVLKNRAQVVVDTLNGADQPGTFDIRGLEKDLLLALRLASEEGGATLPMAAAARASYARAIEAGLGGFDGASLARMLASAK